MENTLVVEKENRPEPNIWKRGPYFWIQYYDAHGRQIREGSHSATLQVAKRLFKRRQGETETGEKALDVIKASVPQDTGKLKNSIKLKVED